MLFFTSAFTLCAAAWRSFSSLAIENDSGSTFLRMISVLDYITPRQQNLLMVPLDFKNKGSRGPYVVVMVYWEERREGMQC